MYMKDRTALAAFILSLVQFGDQQVNEAITIGLIVLAEKKTLINRLLNHENCAS